jgi:nitronate monooxygenase
LRQAIAEPDRFACEPKVDGVRGLVSTIVQDGRPHPAYGSCAMSRVLDDLTHPIVLAPLGGGPATPALAAAVCEAGGLGFLAAGYRATDDVRAEIRDLRGRTASPFGVNVFVPGEPAIDLDAVRAYVATLEPDAERLGVKLGEPTFDDDGWGAKIEMLIEERVAVASFTFGCPPAEVVRSLRDVGTEVWVTATTVEEARRARDLAVDAIVLQGTEAGGHRASWVDDDQAENLGVLPLVRSVASEIDLPLVAAGGIGDGPALAAVLTSGARAGQLGTAFLRASEAGTSEAHRRALASDMPTALTRAFTGRQARGLLNGFMREHGREAPIGYPYVHYATAPLRVEARRRGDADNFHLWAGQAHRLALEAPAGEILLRISRDAHGAAKAVARRHGWHA